MFDASCRFGHYKDVSCQTGFRIVNLVMIVFAFGLIRSFMILAGGSPLHRRTWPLGCSPHSGTAFLSSKSRSACFSAACFHGVTGASVKCSGLR